MRSDLVDALKLDLAGPRNRNGDSTEVLPQQPSRWYLTGFLVPFDAGAAQSSDPDVGDDIDGNGDGSGTDDDVVPERVAASKTRFPSSMGLSVLLPLQTKPSSSTPSPAAAGGCPGPTNPAMQFSPAGRVSGVGFRVSGMKITMPTQTRRPPMK